MMATRYNFYIKKKREEKKGTEKGKARGAIYIYRERRMRVKGAGPYHARVTQLSRTQTATTYREFGACIDQTATYFTSNILCLFVKKELGLRFSRPFTSELPTRRERGKCLGRQNGYTANLRSECN